MRQFSACETEWLKELDGIELASFWQRAIAFVFDWFLITIVFSLLGTVLALATLAVLHARGEPVPSVTQIVRGRTGNFDFDNAEITLPSGAKIKAEKLQDNEVIHIVTDILIPVLYFGILLWTGKGRTPGKRLMRIRVVSIVHPHLSFWHSVERALGYGAAALEAGFGFVQFFIHPYRRCAQDRLAETIVVKESSYQAFQHRLSHPLIPDGEDRANQAAANVADAT